VKGFCSSELLSAIKNMNPVLVFEDDVLFSVGAVALGHSLIELETVNSQSRGSQKA
jgi:GR25 family glycosyltransferase involved in LPS biosynthesis